MNATQRIAIRAPNKMTGDRRASAPRSSSCGALVGLVTRSIGLCGVRVVRLRASFGRASSAVILLGALILAALTLPAASYASEKFEFYTGARMLGMGGAAVAAVNDETAIFTNPAALGKLRDVFITVVDPEIHYGADTTSFLTGFDVDVLQ